MSVVGIDIAKSKFDVARLCEGKYRTKVFSNDPSGFLAFKAWMETFGDPASHLCMEATGRYGEALASFLADHGYR